MKLFIFDFDHTIVNGHTHNAINRSKANRGIEQEYVNSPWEVVHEFSTIGSESDWKEIFENLYQQGHFLSIASFNAYELIIPQFLRKIGLSEELIAQIHIIAGLPENPRTANKNDYIQEAIQYVENYCQHNQYTDGEPLEVIFIDDSKKNIQAAEELGCTTILAKPDGSHLKQLLENYIAPPVNRHLKPQANQAPAEGGCHTIDWSQDLTQAEGEWSSIIQDRKEIPLNRRVEKNIVPPPHPQLPVEEIFADLSLNSDGSTSLKYPDGMIDRFFPAKEAEKAKRQVYKQSNQFCNFYTSQTPANGRAITEEQNLNESFSLEKYTRRK